ncbi:MAG: hypothetical protein JRN29_02365 [Nitrososphaerota archaeon]|nr:hypothetical protein [Nitrososphaerota archaeon]
MGLGCSDGLEEISGDAVYNCVGEFPPGRSMNLWIKGVQVRGVGVVADIKVMHSTEESAVADEFLARFVERLEEELLKR